MFRDLLEYIKEVVKRIVTSRIFALSILFGLLFGSLIFRLFQLQIVQGEDFMNNYMEKIQKTVEIPGTRGNIYDRNGVLLAYNELAYAVTVNDTGDYPKSEQLNDMLRRLVGILDKHKEAVVSDFPVTLDDNGEMTFTFASDSAKRRFLRDWYGLKSVDLLDDKDGKYPSGITAEELFDAALTRYKLTEADWPEELLFKIVNIRYSMSFTEFQKYKTTTVATNIAKETVADILEHTPELKGVNIEEDTIRVYNDSTYFAHIIGYTGKASQDELDALKEKDDSYMLNDMVGKSGIEEAMELKLQGKKGRQTMFVDSVGRILEITEQVDPKAGSDVYLSLDRDLQVGIYKIIEQQLAGVLVKTIVNRDVVVTEQTDSSEIKIPVKDAYYQLLNNNVLSLRDFSVAPGDSFQGQIYAKFQGELDRVLAAMREQLTNEAALAKSALPEDLQTYFSYLYTLLARNSSNPSGILITENIDRADAVYKNYTAGAISFREFLYHGISANWVDSTKLEVESKYSNADEIYRSLVDYMLNLLRDDVKFAKQIYRYLVDREVVTGRELCLALFEQGILAYDENEIGMLTANGSNYAYSFILKKISSLELTPAQLALDPCTGSCVLTDVRTGELLALVTYPGYDNNKLSGTVDGAYYSRLLNDQSLPLYNNATQTRTAPGSTFKPITAIAGLEEGVIGLNELVQTTGAFDKVDPPMKCWIYPNNHGLLDVVGGIRNSCNNYFGEIGYRLSLDSAGNYVESIGVEAFRKYAAKFGLDRLSGVEIYENPPLMTTELPIHSAIGQGTNSYSNVQLNRYLTTVANMGDLYQYTLLDKLTDSEGNVLETYRPQLLEHLEFKDSTWNAVHQGMRDVVSIGSARDIFKDLEVGIAGKTGTAQENPLRANHAWFISYAPYTDPEIGVTVNIPYGYGSSNAAMIAKSVYRLYYEYIDLDTILGKGASEASGVKLGGD